MLGISEVLDLARTPEERKKIQDSIIRLIDMSDDDIDLSDIPERTDYSHSIPAQPYLDRIREHNRKVEEQLKLNK